MKRLKKIWEEPKTVSIMTFIVLGIYLILNIINTLKGNY
jgi:cell division protein FtsX